MKVNANFADSVFLTTQLTTVEWILKVKVNHSVKREK